jgi:ribosomal protein S18 acetylase RimI-like enzyme
MKVIKFAPGLIPVLKHQDHDQSTHGSWADSGSPKLTIMGQNDGVNEFFNERTRVVRYQPEGKEPTDYVLYIDGLKGDTVYAIKKPTDGTTIDGWSARPKGIVGHLDTTRGANPWRNSAENDNKATIVEVAVGKPHQRRGLASAMLRFHRDLFPELDLQHSDTLLPDGQAWAEVAKHGEHDQKTHGNWADGSQGSSSELSDGEISDIISGSNTVNEMYQKVAERLGKSMKPKLEDLSEEEINFFRGVTDVNIQAQSLLNGEIRFTPFQTWGQGIYISSEPEYASAYGDLIGLKLDKSVKLVEGEIAWTKAYSLFDKETSLDMPKILDRITSGKMDNFSDSDIANIYWAAKGYDGYSIYRYGRAEVVLFNADKLTVNKADIGEAVRKHQEHDQSTHGNWALSENYPDLLTLGTFDEESEYDPALMVYSERYGVDKDGKIVGVETFEHDAIDSYSQEGYKNINAFLREPRGFQDSYEIKFLQQKVDGLDSLIDKAPDMFGDKTLFRIVDDFVLAKLTPGDTLRDKGFLSTTRIDLTRDADARDALGRIYDTPDTVAVILPSPTKSGKGIAVDLYRTSVDDTSSVSDREKEVLLPRSTDLLFLGYKRGIGSEEKVAVFQRVDK